jgi:DNA-binding LytR/AlgR family response regulator
MKLKCLIVDDETLARKGIEKFIRSTEDLVLFESCDSSVAALQILQNTEIDILLLDIQMPELTGISLLKQLGNKPVTIITTAYPNYALEGFELEVMDYLIKPISFERFTKAINKAKDYIHLKKKPAGAQTADDDYFFIKCENRYEKLFFDELLYVEAMQNYVVLHTPAKKYVSHLTFKSVEEYLPHPRFVKVQKSFIVAVSKIDNIQGQDIHIGKKVITISRHQKDEVLNTIFGNKILKR